MESTDMINKINRKDFFRLVVFVIRWEKFFSSTSQSLYKKFNSIILIDVT